MSKVTISPVLSSLFRTSDRMTKDEANVLVVGLSEVGGEDVRMSLAQSTVEANGKANYVTIYGDVRVLEVGEVLSNSGWLLTNSEDRGNEGYWIYFLRK